MTDEILKPRRPQTPIQERVIRIDFGSGQPLVDNIRDKISRRRINVETSDPSGNNFTDIVDRATRGELSPYEQLTFVAYLDLADLTKLGLSSPWNKSD